MKKDSHFYVGSKPLGDNLKTPNDFCKLCSQDINLIKYVVKDLNRKRVNVYVQTFSTVGFKEVQTVT